MSFRQTIDRLETATNTRHGDTCVVSKRDIKDILNDWKRMDQVLREQYEQNGYQPIGTGEDATPPGPE